MTPLRLTTLWANQSIRFRIFAGFASLLVIVVAIAALSYFRLVGLRTSFDAYRQRVGVMELSRDVDRRFAEMRRFTREFALGGQPQSAQSAVAAAVQVQQTIAAALAEIHNPDRHAAMVQIGQRFAEYRASLDRVIALRRDADETTARLDLLGRTMLDEARALLVLVSQGGDPDALAAAQQQATDLLLVRLNANKLVGRHDEAALRDADTFTAHLRQDGIQIAAHDPGQLAQLRLSELGATLDGYVAAYHAVAADAAALNTLVNGSMKGEAESISVMAESVKASATAEQTTIGQQAEAAMTDTERLLLAFAAVGVMGGVAASVLIGSGIARPVGAISELMERLVGGELDIAVPWAGRRDEIGRMARSLGVFQKAAVDKLELERAAAAMAGVKDRRQAATDQYTQDFGTTIAGVLQQLTGSAQKMREAAATMSVGASATHKQAVETADGADASARNLATVAAATEEMEASVQEISRQVQDTATASQKAVAQAIQTDTRVRGLARAVDQISAVVNLISDIASRTNLLALNATIEAARAGEAGRGFSVVAGEVKSLAAQTARATQEIAGQIGMIREETAQTVGTVRDVTEAICQVDNAAKTIATAVDQQSHAMREISRSVQEVAATTSSASVAMQTVSSMSQDAGEVSTRVLSGAEEVARVSETLRREVIDFLGSMSKTDEDIRRRYERIPGRRARATLRLPGQQGHAPQGHAPQGHAGSDLWRGREQQFEISDISRSGAALLCEWQLEVGSEVEILLPSADARVPARVVRQADNLLAVTFRQDQGSLMQIDAVLELLAVPPDPSRLTQAA